MKTVIFFSLFTIIVVSASAQQRDSITVSVDTINIRGIIYTADGVPAKHMEITHDWWIPIPGYHMRTKTDTNGYFELKGVNPNDKLLFTDGKYGNARFPIKGSRFIVVYLPPPKMIEINPWDSIVVKTI